jgi:hypothetical protein
MPILLQGALDYDLKSRTFWGSEFVRFYEVIYERLDLLQFSRIVLVARGINGQAALISFGAELSRSLR